MFWWIHGIFGGIMVGLVTLCWICKSFFYSSKIKVLKHLSSDCYNFGFYCRFGYILNIFALLSTGIFYLAKNPNELSDEAKVQWLSRNTMSIEEYSKLMNDSVSLGWKWWIIIPVIIYFIIGIIVFVQYESMTSERELEKIKKAYEKSRYSKDPQIKAVADILAQSIKKIERQEQMKDIYSGIKAIKKMQNDNDYIEVQKEIDELQALYELEDYENKYAKK